MKIYFLLGFLGSGKTTLLQSMLSNIKGEKIACLINDYASDTDSHLIDTNYDTEVVEGGSLFCSCRQDQFLSKVQDIYNRGFDTCIIESSGLSNPINMSETLLFMSLKCGAKLDFRGAITVIDAGSFEKILSTVQLTRIQVAFADLIIVNKCDLVDTHTLDRVISLAQTINIEASLITTSHCNVAIDTIINMHHSVHKNCANIIDINTQKVEFDPSNYSYEQIKAIAEKLSVIAHRIKGVIKINDEYFVYQYQDSVHTLSPTCSGQTHLSVLAVTPRSLNDFVNLTLNSIKPV